MKFDRWPKQFLPLILVFLILLSACSAAPSKYDQVQQDTTGFRAPAAVDKAAEKGGTFNQFFPKSEGEYEVVPAQEKKGFAEYKLKRDGETVAMLSINDTISLPAAAAKYDNAPATLAGFPAVQQGTTATGVLVNGRYQVKVLSRVDSFTAADRAAWIEKFDLQGLAQLEARSQPARPVKTASPVPATSAVDSQTAPALVPQPAS